MIIKVSGVLKIFYNVIEKENFRIVWSEAK